ncbi:unnamed protein product, partial [marine sediment metagenome]
MKLEAEDVWTWIYGYYQKGLLDPVTSWAHPTPWLIELYRKGHWDGVYRYVHYDRSRRQYYFPTGFLDRVEAYLAKINHPHMLVDKRTFEICDPETQQAPYELHGDQGSISLIDGKYAYQADAINAGLLFGRGILQLATGGGKTEVGAAIIKALGRRTVWFTHRKTLLHQTRER